MRKDEYPNSKPKSKEPRNFTEDTEIQSDYEDSEDYEDLEEDEGVHLAMDPVTSLALDTSLPLRTFVAKAAKLSADAALNSDCMDGWKSTTWEFTRNCKTHPKLMSLTADEAYEEIPWNVTDFGEDEQLTFLAEWSRVRILPGVPPLQWAATLAHQQPLVTKRPKLKVYNKFISLAGWLQVVVGPDVPIFLPVRNVADIIGKSHATVATMCKVGVADGLLVLIERATTHRAARYRFAVERFEVLRDWKGV